MVPGTSTSYLSSQNITTTSTVPTAKTASTVNIQTCRLDNAEIVLVVLACIVTLIVLFFNGFILWKLTFMRCNRRKSRGNYDILLSYLSMFDLLSAVTMTARIYTELTRCSNSLSWPLGLVGCKTVLPLYDISINMSVCILIIISIDRCQRVMTPLKRTLKRKRIHVFVFISALVSFGVYFERFITAKVKHGMCGHVLEGLLSLSPLLVWVIRDIAFLVTFTTTSFCIQRSLRNRQFPLFTTNRHKKQSRSISRMLIFTQLVFTALVLPYDILSSISLGYGMFAKTSNKIAGLKPWVFYRAVFQSNLANVCAKQIYTYVQITERKHKKYIGPLIRGVHLTVF